MNLPYVEKIAAFTLVILLSLVIIFHLFVLTTVVPYDIVWGGRLGSQSEMIVFEIISILINLLMITVVAKTIGLVAIRINRNVSSISLWIMSVLFILNTLGNLTSKNDLERLIFTPLTLLLGILSIFLAIRSLPHEKR